MKVNELRVGNWVDNGAGHFYVIDTSWFMDILNYAQVNEMETDLNPIPLTDDWMIRFGFEKRKNYRPRRNGISSKSWFMNNSEIFSIEKHDVKDFYDDDIFYPTLRYSNRVIAVTEVHQLQNLYHAISWGGELTIK